MRTIVIAATVAGLLGAGAALALTGGQDATRVELVSPAGETEPRVVVEAVPAPVETQSTITTVVAPEPVSQPTGSAASEDTDGMYTQDEPQTQSEATPQPLAQPSSDLPEGATVYAEDTITYPGYSAPVPSLAAPPDDPVGMP